jgi:hypothetical protein
VLLLTVKEDTKMSRVLSELLEAKEPWFSQSIRAMEAASLHPNLDIRMTTEIGLKAQQKMRELGLDPRNTNGWELYQSLQDLVAIHDSFLAQALGIKDASSVYEVLPKLLPVIKKLPISKSSWALKHSVVRRLLKENQPKKTMKELGYRSVDSMLKREPVSQVLAAARLVEPLQWQKRFTKSYAGLEPTDFEIRSVEIVLPTSRHWQVLGGRYAQTSRHNVLQLRELGTIIVLPLPNIRLRGAAITLLSVMLHQLNELRVYSTFFKMQQVKPQFGEIISDVLLKDTPRYAELAGQQLHWRVLHRYMGRQSGQNLASIFEPHVQIEDLEWRGAEELLYRIEPALKFWEGMDSVGVIRDGKPISLSLHDNVLNYCNGLEYGQQRSKHMQANLWDELYIRYLEQETISQKLAEQFEDSTNRGFVIAIGAGA